MTDRRNAYSRLSRFAVATAITLLASALSASEEAAVSHRQNDNKDVAAEVLEYLTHTLGRWESNTTYFDREGRVTKQEIEGFGEEVLVENHLNLHSSYNADGSVNKAFRFYSPQDDRFYLIDVTATGSWWVISGSRGSNVMHSQPKELADGRTVILRFTHSDIQEDSFDAIAEVSYDGGSAWRKISHQSYRKVAESPEREY